MGFMLLSRKRSLINDTMSGNPNKKMKLEFQNDGNDDLWGQDDDITAEEFDLLEIQATQSCTQNCKLVNNALPTASLFPKPSSSFDVQDSKQLQYELEGRVKLLSLSLEKSIKELNEERLHRERLISERIKQFHEQETNLKKEIEKMQSILEFKEQEMKVTYSKLQMLKSQSHDKKSFNTDVSVNANFEDFFKSSKYEEHSVRHDRAVVDNYHRKYKLSVDMPNGEMNGTEILSSILCTSLTVPFLVNKENIANTGCFAHFSCYSSLTPATVLHLKNEQKCDEILEYYCKFLENHVKQLKTLAAKNNQIPSNISFISAKPKELFCSETVVSYLKDITYIYSSPNFKFHHPNINRENESPSQSEKITLPDSTLSLLQSLSTLSDPRIYPIGYHKKHEMEFAISALFSISLSCPKDFLDLIRELPCYFFSNPHESVTGLCTTIKLLTVLCPNKNFLSYITHKDSSCVFCLIASFLLVNVSADPEKFGISFILIENFLSSVFSVYNFKETKLSSCCISKVIQGIIKSLWKYFQIREHNASSFIILKKGFLLLNFISSNIPNFKENRNPVEDEYVSLVSGTLAISKENSEFRLFHDLVHNLWDFQTDISEFDLEELSEETHACTNDTE